MTDEPAPIPFDLNKFASQAEYDSKTTEYRLTRPGTYQVVIPGNAIVNHPPEKRSRKVVQIIPYELQYVKALALCDDGTFWMLTDGAWLPLPTIPQPEEG